MSIRIPQELSAASVLDSMSDGFVAFDRDWCFTYVNTRGAEIQGRSAESLIGRKLFEIYPEAIGTPFEQAYRKAMIDRVPTHVEAYYPPWDRWFDQHVYPTADGIAVFFVDVTERRRTANLSAGQSRVLEMIAIGTPLHETLDALIRIIETDSPDMLGSILLLDDDGIHLRHGAAPSLPAGFVSAIDGKPIGPSAGSCGTAAYRREAVIVEDIERDSLWADYRQVARDHGLRASWSTPIFDPQRRVLGTFAMYFRKPARPTGHHNQLVETATQTAAIAIQKAKGDQERTRVQTDLRNRVSMFRSVFESAAIGITMVTMDQQFMNANPAFAKMLGYTQKELLGRRIGDLSDTADAEENLQLYRALAAGEIDYFQIDKRYRRKDGGIVWGRVTVSRVPQEGSTPSFTIGMIEDITERKKSDEDLLRFRAAMDASGDAILLVDRAQLRYIDVNQTFCELVGYTRAELLGMTPMDLFSADRETLERDYDGIIADNDSGANKVEGQYRRKDGALIPIETRRRALHTKDGWIIVGTARDITERKEAEAKISSLNRVYAVLSGINAAIVRIRDQAALFDEVCQIAVSAGKFPLAWIGVVDRAKQVVSVTAWKGNADGYLDQMPLALLSDRPADWGMAGKVATDARTMVANNIANDPHIVIKQAAIDRGFSSLIMLPLLVGGKAVAVLALYSEKAGFFDGDEVRLLNELAGDISFALDHLENASKLDYLAYYDSLTGLANRNLFLDRLSQYVNTAKQNHGKLAIILADVERFKAINDSLGRQAGDELLKQLAARVIQVVDPATIARIGADHFAIVLPKVRGKSETERNVDRLARECFAQPYRVGATELLMSARAGIAVFPRDGTDAEALLSCAEAALKKAKETGQRRHFYTRKLTEGVAEQLTLETKLRRAIDNDEFVLHYQPKVDSVTGHIVGVEALIRWQSPDLGLVPPMKFISLLEETGLILPVGAWALSRASADHRRWIDQGLKAPRVAVNVSPIQLRQRGFVGIVERAIAEGVTPTGIDLEITESLIMEDIQGNIEKLKSIRGLGASIAIDDFGTGYSSLAYLAKLPVQTLKIDRSFVITMLTEVDQMTLVQTMISLAHSLKLKVVAEGVDSEDQAKMLRLLHCDEMQGYLFSRPVPFDQMTTMLQQGSDVK